MKNEIQKLEEIVKAIKAEDDKRDKALPANPHLSDAVTRGRLMIKSLNRYQAEQDAAAAVHAPAPAAKK